MPLLAALKTETADRHIALENGMNLFGRASSKEGYRDLLRRFYTLYRPMERRLMDSTVWEAAVWNFQDRLKTGWLAEDLRALGMPPADIEAMPLCPYVPCVENLGQVVGCLYVLEGSTLGGQFISKRLRETLDITPETGGRFFSGYGSETGTRWKGFGEWAEDIASVDPSMEPVAVQTAKETFDCFFRWFDC